MISSSQSQLKVRNEGRLLVVGKNSNLKLRNNNQSHANLEDQHTYALTSQEVNYLRRSPRHYTFMLSFLSVLFFKEEVSLHTTISLIRPSVRPSHLEHGIKSLGPFLYYFHFNMKLRV